MQEEDGNKLETPEGEMITMITTDGRCSADAVVNKASWTLIKKTFRFFNVNLFKKLNFTLVRAHIEFASSVQNTLSNKEIRKKEGFRRELRGWF